MNVCDWFSNLEERDLPEVGTEALYMARLYRAGLPVIPGFVISSAVYHNFISQADLMRKLKEHVKGLTLDDGGHFAPVSAGMRKCIQEAPLSQPIRVALFKYFTELKAHVMHTDSAAIAVTVRCILEDGSEYSLTETIKSPDSFVSLVKDLYVLPIQGHLLYKRLYEGKALLPSPYSVMVKFAPIPDSSGTFSCYDSKTKDGNTIAIQARHLSSSNVKESGKDVYRVDRSSLAILTIGSGNQLWAASHDKRLVHPGRMGKHGRVLQDEAITRLSRLANLASGSVDTHTVSWVYSRNQFWLTGVKEQCPEQGEEMDEVVKPLVRGIPVAPGWVYGPVHIMRHGEACPSGSIAVVKHIHTHAIANLAAAKGIISEDPATSHERAITCLHVPTISAIHHAAGLLENGQVVTLDSMHGVIYNGIHNQPFAPRSAADTLGQTITATEVCSASQNPYEIDGSFVQGSDGVGLVRAECILQWLGMEPKDIHMRKQADEYEEILAEVLERAKISLEYRPLMYQLHDFTGSHSIGKDRGIHHKDSHPLLGYRGAKRLMHEPETVALQLRSLSKIVKSGHDNVHIVLPMSHNIDELEDMVHDIRRELSRHLGKLPLWAKVETPGMLIEINKICREPIEGVLIDVPAVTQLVMGIDKGNARIGHTYSMADPSVLRLLEAAIRTCRQSGKDIYLVAEDEPMAPEVIEYAVAAGISGITVPATFIGETRHMVAVAEQRVLLEGLRNHSSNPDF